MESCEEAGGGLIQLSCGDGGIWTGRTGGRAEGFAKFECQACVVVLIQTALLIVSKSTHVKK